MPNTGDRSTHDCPDCGEPMYWTEAAVRHPTPPAGTLPSAEATMAYFDAYRCTNGHTSERCSLCGSYDTAAWSHSKNLPHYHVICGNCGNDSVADK